MRLLKLMGLDTAVLASGLMAGLIVGWPWADALLGRIAPGKDLGVYVGIVAFVTFLAFTVWEAMV